MLKHITVPIIIDDHEPEKCGECAWLVTVPGYSCTCILFEELIKYGKRCKQCLDDLFPCNSELTCRCEAGRKVPCDSECGEDHNFHITLIKEAE